MVIIQKRNRYNYDNDHLGDFLVSKKVKTANKNRNNPVSEHDMMDKILCHSLSNYTLNMNRHQFTTSLTPVKLLPRHNKELASVAPQMFDAVELSYSRLQRHINLLELY